MISALYRRYASLGSTTLTEDDGGADRPFQRSRNHDTPSATPTTPSTAAPAAATKTMLRIRRVVMLRW